MAASFSSLFLETRRPKENRLCWITTGISWEIEWGRGLGCSKLLHTAGGNVKKLCKDDFS
jgi:hypothetical protein